MNIYVGNLPFETDEQALQEHFEQYGQVASARVIMDRYTGRSRGFGFVEMPDDNEARRAIEATDQQDFMGRSLRVNEARSRDGGGGGGGGNRGGGGWNDRGDRGDRRY